MINPGLDRIGLWKGVEPLRVTAMDSGVNSRSARVEMPDGKKYLVKSCIEVEGSYRNRLKNEFESLSFLWEQGERRVPHPIHFDDKETLAVYGWIEGARMDAASIRNEDAASAVDFYRGLQEYRSAASRVQIAPAAEACFSVEEHLRLIDERLARLREVPDHEAQGWVRELEAFWTKHQADVKSAAKQRGCDVTGVLESGKRVLSPSDVGFHNILKRKDGALAFIDFEYFGWDDSVKMACDFLLEPGIPCPEKLKSSTAKNFSLQFDWKRQDKERFALLYPVLAFKWCLILLNVFLTPHQKKTRGNTALNSQEQLRKSRAFFETLTQALKTREYEAWISPV